MDKKSQYLELKDLEVYVVSRKYSSFAWNIYSRLNWQQKKIIGDQFIRSTDSISANIAEGYGRFHYLDKNKFYYNARGSLLESRHWAGLMLERLIITKEEFSVVIRYFIDISKMLNKLIKSQNNRKQQL
ncbi:MAG: four helix bundle protein [Candidatus Buchananbacteria bacterium RIFCSPHIGHO2_02_FULL_40_13]|uniref:Four helix bundle protein n=1 Tax=Candidatus Buchananbacteria bacterium RIFCSPLOWO2_01_FULL_39_33 TaxID=1797543 RepID=A0A1G1YK53_9BACT|nr:MAG: four helix bundle protein [Candidatus Buchananbacteria bacterium RIFCSPHIGHO2_01_FULL_40_35]OGY49779.1 MAG: four helix bundle protein [Candidatus Buchananbacteria bacterium RIFCSPHIGHO2_02_FULL_40_13]OGY52725.1 MAG: four helix bundle protein [Candidatus Buchananbacteria bacterium RIFCSPLOWO2_01_FULL_39_33]